LPEEVNLIRSDAHLAAAVVAHVGIPGPTPFVATGLFFVGLGATAGAYWLFSHHAAGLRRAVGFGLGAIAFGTLALGTALPFIIRPGPLFTRPSTRARLEILSPTRDEVIRGDPATVSVVLRMEGGRIVPFTSIHLIPNEGHIHLYMDGKLVSMTGLDTRITVSPGDHKLLAEFVAVDHGPFHPRVEATVDFSVRR
jgi:hypothetical protein